MSDEFTRRLHEALDDDYEEQVCELCLRPSSANWCHACQAADRAEKWSL